MVTWLVVEAYLPNIQNSDDANMESNQGSNII